MTRRRRGAVGRARAQHSGAVTAGAAVVHKEVSIAGSVGSDSRADGMQRFVNYQ